MSRILNDDNIITRSPNNVEYDNYTTCTYTLFENVGGQYIHHPEVEYNGIRLTKDSTSNCNYNREEFTREITSSDSKNSLVTWNIIRENNESEETSNYLLRVEIAPMVATVTFKRFEDGEVEPVSIINISFINYANYGSVYVDKVQKTYYILIKSYKSDSTYNEQKIITKIHESYLDSHLTQINNTPYNRQYNQITTKQFNSESSDYQDCQISISASYAKLWLGYDKGIN